MQHKREYSERFREFVKIQNDNNLADIQVDDVFLWRLIRAQIFTYLLEDKKIIHKPETKNLSVFAQFKLGIKNQIITIFTPEKWKQFPRFFSKVKTTAIDIVNILPSLFFTSRLLFLGTQKPVFISAFIRNIGVDHRLTRPAEDKYAGKNILLDKPSAGLFAMRRLDTRAFNMIAKSFYKTQLNEDINPAVLRISKAYDIDQNIIKKIATKQIKAFKAHEAAFLYFFQKSNFEKIFLCWNRYYMPLLSAAKKANIKTAEFQHGTITPYHIMYSWEGFNDVPYAPDHLLCFGPSWPENSNLAKSIKPVIIGAPHLEACVSKYSKQNQDENRVVIFSQNLIGQKLLNFSLAVARLRPDLNFIFKPHPTENYANITHYAEGKIPKNFTFASPNDDSYALMASSTYQIGVSSTTLNEGMVFGNRVIVVPFASWEYMETATSKGHAVLAESAERAAELLTQETLNCANPEDYYAPIDLSKV